MSKLKQIIIPGTKPVQLNLLLSPGHESITNSNFNPFPLTLRGNNNIKKVVEESSNYIGLDFEFDVLKSGKIKPTVIGVSNNTTAASSFYDKETLEFIVNYCEKTGTKIVGYSVIGAEKAVIESIIKRNLNLNLFEDAMLTHFLLNQDLNKLSQGKEADDKGSLGFMGLWTGASLYLDLPQWKLCRGLSCSQTYCPSHDVLGYNSIDAYAGLSLFNVHSKELQKNNVPLQAYLDLKELSFIAQKMEDTGVKVDRDQIDKFELASDEEKEKLFSTEKGDYEYFNPNSSKQVLEYFSNKSIFLKSNSKSDIIKEITKLAKKYYNCNYEEFLTREEFELEEHEQLRNLALYKGAGKGLKSWFNDKYFKYDNLLHPRWITIGTSTGRWSSSNPNFTNIPARGFGSFVRKVIIPIDENCNLIKYDASNLEFRCCLYLAGYDLSKLGKDPFTDFVNDSNNAFAYAAKLAGSDERFIAKSVSHAGDYLEGIELISDYDLNSVKTQKLEKAGALRIHRDWRYCGYTIGFNGVNLSQRLFGEASWENRRTSLYLQEDLYFKKFPELRKLQKETLRKIEKQNYLQLPTGNFLRLYGLPRDNAKIGMAFLGQGLGAQHVQGDILRFHREHNKIPYLFVHDELVFQVPKSWSDKQCRDFMSLSEEEDKRIKGFICPVKMKRGNNWLEMKGI